MPISMVSMIKGTTFSSRLAKTIPKVKSNEKGFKFKEYYRHEVVDFKNGETRGQIVHDGPFLSEMVSNITSASAILACIHDAANNKMGVGK